MSKNLIIALLMILIVPRLSFSGGNSREWSEFVANRDFYLEDLSKSVISCETRSDTLSPVFHGCVDWHSSVHGYWALLRAAKYTKNKKCLDFAMDAVTSPALAQERAFLKANKSFEMPYGRAWFLRLAIEFETISMLPTLRPMADEIAQSLVAFYRHNPPSPGTGEYKNAEWAFRNLYDYARFTKNQKIAGFVTSSLKYFLDPRATAFLAKDKEAAPEFFSRSGNYFHFLEAAADTKTFLHMLDKCQIDPNKIEPVTKFENDHHLGLNFSRAWGLWSIYKKTNKEEFRNAYLKSVMAGLNEHAQYKNNYNKYGHWVSQFGIYAITYPFEDPAAQEPL